MAPAPGRAALAVAGAAAGSGLLLALVVIGTGAPAPSALYQRSAYDRTGLSAGQRVSIAQAKVARDLAALRQTEAMTGVDVGMGGGVGRRLGSKPTRSQMCPHQRRRERCKECGGSSM
jgi:hypothetical protein